VNVGSLFAGVGGFDLGFERAGMRVSWQVEQDPYCRAVLARHFPDAARFEDVREVGAQNLCPVDLLCGGFPCQDLSPAGKGAGIDGARSGLWSEFARIVCELRPRYVVVENVPALLTGKGKRWDRAPVGRVLGDLAEARYDAEWACLSAREFGAPHLRKRVWIVAYPARDAEAGPAAEPGTERQRAGAGGERSRAAHLADAEGERERPGFRPSSKETERRRRPSDRRGAGGALADADQRGGSGRPAAPRSSGARVEAADADAAGREEQRCAEPEPSPNPSPELDRWWAAEPGVGRVADGVPRRVDRLAALGNALVPQIAEWIGRRILDHERRADQVREGAMI
jgi:DNA (cytosine-5)-methyltransferase 1